MTLLPPPGEPGAEAEEARLCDALEGLRSVRREPRRSAGGRAALMAAAAQRRELLAARGVGAWRRRLLVGALSLAGAGGALGGVVAASASTMPDSRLYAVKRAVEDVRLFLTPRGEARAQLEFELAERRADEASAMAARGRDDLAVAAVRDAQPLVADATAILGTAPTSSERDALQHLGRVTTARLTEVIVHLEAKHETQSAATVEHVLDKLDSEISKPESGNNGSGKPGDQGKGNGRGGRGNGHGHSGAPAGG